MRKIVLIILCLCVAGSAFCSVMLNDRIRSKTWFENGKFHYQKKDFKKSVECLEKSIMIDPDNIDAQVLLSRVLNMAVRKVSEKNKAAEKKADFSISREPKKNYLSSGNSLSMTQDLMREAKGKGKFTMLDKYLTPKKKTEIHANINETIEKTTQKVDAQMIEEYNQKGMEYARKQDFKMAIDQFNRILDMDQGNVMAMSNLGLAFAYNDQLYDAVKMYKKIMDLAPVNTKYYKQARKMIDKLKGFM